MFDKIDNYSYFRISMSRIYILLILAICFSCKKREVFAPIGGEKKVTDLDISKERNKNRNAQERKFIEDWIAKSNQNYFPTTENYWSSIDFSKRTMQNSGKLLYYEYDVYDFNNEKTYPAKKIKDGVYPIKEREVLAIEDALMHMQKNEETTLLVPSVLAFGSKGDGDRIPNDLPVIIKLKLNDIY